MTDRPVSTRLPAGAVFALAGFSALTITLALASAESQDLFVILLRMPGRFLVQSFHLVSWCIPVILGVAGWLLVTRRAAPLQLALLTASALPFLTAAASVRLAADARVAISPLTAFVADAVGRGAGAVLAGLFAALQVALMLLAWHRWRDVPVRAAAQPPGPRTDLRSGTRRVRALLAAPRVIHAPDSLLDLPEPADEGQPADAVLPASPVSASEPVAEPELDLFYRDGAFSTAAVADDEDAAGDPAEDSAERGAAVEYAAAEDAAAADAAAADAAAADAAAEPSPPDSGPGRRGYDVPIAGILQDYGDSEFWHIDQPTRDAAEILRVTLDEFGIQAEVTGIRKGPVITMLEILPAPGVKLSRIVNLSDNIALRLAAASVRIVAPIPGKHAVGIEIPNRERAIVGFGELLREEAFRSPRMEIPIALGKDIPGDAQIVDLTRMPHVLIAGATGSGKSVCVNSIICSVLYRRSPAEVKMILIDPKIVELKFYNDIPHLLTPVVTDPKRAFQALQYCIYEMERRYTLLDSLQVRDVQSYNRKIRSRSLAMEPLPYIVIVVDEFADLMATSGKELESTLARLAAMSRAVGLHLVLATQRPSTDVITGLIKANIPSRIAFMVASKIDSRIILDSMGAEKLLGRGDMLFSSAWDPFPVRMQGAFLSEEEVERVVTHVKQLGEPEYIDDEIFLEDDEEDFVQGELEDPLMERAVEIVSTAGKASASYLQRRLKVGYNRAARMVEEMERLGIVGPQQGSKPRDVIGAADRY